MTWLVFPDNTVLINFAYINRFDVLAEIVKSNGQWCATVAKECHQSAEYPGLGSLSRAGDIFGDPIFPESQTELLLSRQYRMQLSSPGDEPRKHIGEAETLAIISERSLPAIFVTDDTDAARLARALNVQSITTWHVLKLAWKARQITQDTLWGYMQTLRSYDRKLPDGVYNEASFEYWLHNP